jgi:hypothetical protein
MADASGSCAARFRRGSPARCTGVHATWPRKVGDAFLPCFPILLFFDRNGVSSRDLLLAGDRFFLRTIAPIESRKRKDGLCRIPLWISETDGKKRQQVTARKNLGRGRRLSMCRAILLRNTHTATLDAMGILQLRLLSHAFVTCSYSHSGSVGNSCFIEPDKGTVDGSL